MTMAQIGMNAVSARQYGPWQEYGASQKRESCIRAINAKPAAAGRRAAELIARWQQKERLNLREHPI